MQTRRRYTRQLMRTDQIRRAERDLVLLLRRGLASGEGIKVGRSYWADKRRRARRMP